jgi:hypothetical protein
MGKRTSVYLADDLAAAVEKTGLPLAELIRRGIYGPPARPVVVSPCGGVPQQAAAAVVPAGSGASAPAPCRPRCPQCRWRALQPVRAGERTSCESCGFGFTAEDGQVPR